MAERLAPESRSLKPLYRTWGLWRGRKEIFPALATTCSAR